MHYVYLIRSLSNLEREFIGNTADIEERLEIHNSGLSPYTKSDRPWELIVAVTFADKPKAIAFEKYLKSNSGRAFAREHFW